MRKFITAGMAVAMLAIPTAAMAAPVDHGRRLHLERERPRRMTQGNLVGEYTSQITHNGRWVQDQIADKGGRSAVVQSVLAQDGLGRTK